jgi:hypothetical protein
MQLYLVATLVQFESQFNGHLHVKRNNAIAGLMLVSQRKCKKIDIRIIVNKTLDL